MTPTFFVLLLERGVDRLQLLAFGLLLGQVCRFGLVYEIGIVC